MLGDEPDEIAKDGLALAFRELVILGQPRRQMLEGDGTARFGRTCRCHCLSCARRRHDGLPSSEARKCASGRRYDSRLDGKSLCAQNAANRASFGPPPPELPRERELFTSTGRDSAAGSTLRETDTSTARWQCLTGTVEYHKAGQVVPGGTYARRRAPIRRPLAKTQELPMTIGKNRGRGMAVGLAVALCGMGMTPAHAQAQQEGFAAIIDAARAHPGCLGVDTGRTTSGKQVIFAWFENKAALVAWYKSDAHQRAMKVAFPERTFERDPLPDTPDNSGQILAIVSLKLRDAPRSEGALPIDTIGIELYTPLPGGVAVGGRFAPQAIRVPALREIDLATAAGRTR